MSKVTLTQRYDELKGLGYDYLINHDVVDFLMIDMEELGVTGFVDSVGGVNTFSQDRFVYEDFMNEIITQGVQHIVVVRDNANGSRDYFKCDDMGTLKPLTV